ncbi:copper resistance protein CopC [Dactylosporangium sp. CS-047395]|uniref:copper resistance protein CopC n=1 Tax=Dactylosporangium sp. CS-047395 TaxID=3239936 RepID=UPI003D8AF4AE
MAFGLLATLVAPARPAAAHAVLTTTSPMAGTVLPALPKEIRLAFNEAVRVVPGKTQVVGPDGKRRNDGDPAAVDGGLLIKLRDTDPPVGTYVVSYRVVSGDSHPVAGSFMFSVGAPSQPAAGTEPVGTDPIVAVAVPVAKYAGYAGLVLLIGPAVMLALWYPRRLNREPLLRLARAGIIAIGAGTVVSIWLQAPLASGAALLNVSPGELGQVLTSPFGITLLARLAALTAIATQIRRIGRGTRQVALTTAVVAMLVTWPLTGHPRASPYTAVVVVADVVHIAAMGLWIGGLICLWAVLLPRADQRELAVILPSWSKWAMASVYWLVAAGVLQALIQVGGWAAITGTQYGEILLVKVGLVALILLAAAWSRRMVHKGRTARLRTTVGLEAGVAALVLAVSAVLVQLSPGRSADLEPTAAVQAQGFAATLNSPLYAVQFEVYPAVVSEYNSFHAFVFTPEGKPLPVEQWTVTAALPDRGVEPMDNPVYTVTGNQGLGNITFPLPGTWKLTITLRVSEFDQATVIAEVPVR